MGLGSMLIEGWIRRVDKPSASTEYLCHAVDALAERGPTYPPYKKPETIVRLVIQVKYESVDAARIVTG